MAGAWRLNTAAVAWSFDQPRFYGRNRLVKTPGRGRKRYIFYDVTGW